jgi:hypothetical protein
MRQAGDSVPKRVVIGAQAKQQPESPTPDCAVDAIELGKVGRRVIEASLTGGAISSDKRKPECDGPLVFRVRNSSKNQEFLLACIKSRETETDGRACHQ